MCRDSSSCANQALVRRPHRRPVRAAVTLIELLIAMSVVTMLVAALAVMARAVQLGAEYSEGHSIATQHARVALERITAAIQDATANESFPGVAVLESKKGTNTFPNTLVVWRPAAAPANPTGQPLLKELIIFCTDPADQSHLVEITAPSNTTTLSTDPTTMQTQIDGLKTSTSSNKVMLTDLIRVGTVGTGTNSIQGCVRFLATSTPSAADWAAYKASTTPWNNLPWVQNIHGTNTGLRQVRVAAELQLMPGEEWILGDPAGMQAVPFLGSAALYYEMHK